MAKQKCNFECYKNGTCPFPDCITDDVTTEEMLKQDIRDRNYTNYGFIPQARMQRKERGTRGV